jgi:hypothetical protein
MRSGIHVHLQSISLMPCCLKMQCGNIIPRLFSDIQRHRSHIIEVVGTVEKGKERFTQKGISQHLQLSLNNLHSER